MGLIKNLSISFRINLIVVTLGLLAVAISLVGHRAVDKVAVHFQTAYQDRVVPVGQLPRSREYSATTAVFF